MPAQDDIHIYLASESPRRRELLERIGVRFATLPQGVDETPHDGESPEVFVIRLALEKARAGLAHRPAGDPRPVLAADTAVVVDDRILGKPQDRSEAMTMLQRLAGRAHRVLTGVAMVDGEQEATRLSLSGVTLRPIAEAEIQAYWASGEPQGKAGGYAVQGRGGVFVEQLEGSYSGVMGLPLFEAHDLLTEFGVDYQASWREGR
ncbi:Maf family protein [Spiribacter halobius]|uniref:dTTP/UTP pyrophosphatase n=1 Tax=Sediminicurvatus halobius TaxID=2182432 RepID=A0A2U2N4Q2_9GAMM|nr:nucleoside triphosphate pyrophosphatase [Spiribacter halobius]PWG64100.1 septum formation protein Maf [Spiribacter halobius]PWG65261.1 septum formation protein Maf [Spiribacter halobius]UEX78783.1 Maf family nucleotide pyrophosphatase [Spiribacter halobius]